MTLEELEAVVAAQALEIGRLDGMIQQLSESVDQNRREVNFAATQLVAKADELEQATQRAEVIDGRLRDRENKPG